MPKFSRSEHLNMTFLHPTAEVSSSCSELYHENSKLYPSDRMTYYRIHLVNTSTEIRQIIARPFRRYAGFPTVPLTRHFRPTERSLEETILGRRSARVFSGLPLELDTLAKVLYFGDGVTGTVESPDGVVWSLRGAPSGGGLYPVEIYCVVLRVNDLVPGIYAYDALHHSLVLLSEGAFTGSLQDATFLQDEVSKAGVCVLMAGVMQRTQFKYGERGYRFVLLEAGHIAQNILLVAQAQGIGAVPIGGFVDDMLNKLLGLDGCDEAVLYSVLLGSL